MKQDWDRTGNSEAEEASQTLAQIIATLEGMLGRPSRWAGVVELTDNLFAAGIAHLDGRVEITRAIWRQPQYRWRTAIHEALHLFSPPYTKYAYSTARGWEEGVVEQMQRLLRQEALGRMGVTVPESAFAERDAQHEYNHYIHALESLRQPLALSAPDFYRWLLATPLPERLGAVQERGGALPDQTRLPFRRTLLLSQATLGRL